MVSASPGNGSLLELQERRNAWHAVVGPPIQWPEPPLTLDLSSRKDSEVRIFRYLHQACALHRENYSSANQVRHLYLVDAFIALVEAQNILGIYGIARSMFELSAFLHEVKERLSKSVKAISAGNWRQVGESYFAIIVRARFATSNPKFQAMLRDQGGSPKRLEPFNVTHCIKGLSAHAGHEDAIDRYSILCDFVHHNLGSSSTANSGSMVADAARSVRGGAIIGRGPMTITQYEYPVSSEKISKVVDDVTPGFLRDALSCVAWLNATPEGPFSPETMSVISQLPQ